MNENILRKFIQGYISFILSDLTKILYYIGAFSVNISLFYKHGLDVSSNQFILRHEKRVKITEAVLDKVIHQASLTQYPTEFERL